MENIIKLHPQLFRTYEIALLGNFKLSIMLDPKYVKGYEDYLKIKSVFNDIQFSTDADMTVQIYEHNVIDLNYDASLILNNIRDKVEKSKNNIRPTNMDNQDCQEFFDFVINKLNLPIENSRKVLEISKVIAQLDNSKTITVQHIAEAIQFYVYESTLVNPENLHKSSKLGLNLEDGKLSISDVINRLEAMKKGDELPPFDHDKKNDPIYCVEWGIKKGEWIADGIIDRYIKELKELVV